MKVLLCGASGFVGRNIERGLVSAGVQVVRAQRSVSRSQDVVVDFARDTQAQVWRDRVRGMDAVVNAVGILRDGVHTPMQAIHSDTPRAIFDACVAEHVPHVVQISALGAGGDLNTAYMRTKFEADAHLLSLPVRSNILRPSVIYGQEGDSAKMFRLLARLPVLTVPGHGESMMQPVHINDVVAAVVQLLQAPQGVYPQIVAAVGPAPLSYREMIATYRAQFGLGKAWVLPMPWSVMQWVARVSQWIPSSALEPDTLAMLRAGSVADGTDFERVLGRPALHPKVFLDTPAL